MFQGFNLFLFNLYHEQIIMASLSNTNKMVIVFSWTFIQTCVNLLHYLPLTSVQWLQLHHHSLNRKCSFSIFKLRSLSIINIETRTKNSDSNMRWISVKAPTLIKLHLKERKSRGRTKKSIEKLYSCLSFQIINDNIIIIFL